MRREIIMREGVCEKIANSLVELIANSLGLIAGGDVAALDDDSPSVPIDVALSSLFALSNERR